MAALRFRFAPPTASHGAGGNLALTNNADHSVGAGHRSPTDHGQRDGEFIGRACDSRWGHPIELFEFFWTLRKNIWEGNACENRVEGRNQPDAEPLKQVPELLQLPRK